MNEAEQFPLRCRIIGVLDDGAASLHASALQHVRQADLVIGATRTLQLFAAEFSVGCETRDLNGRLSLVPEWIRQALSDQLKVVVLASGDPLCHGIAGFLVAHLCIEACEILPNVSTLQLACARIGLPWQDVKIASVHARDAGEWHIGAGLHHGLAPLLRDISRHDRLAILTSPDNTPDRIARMLVQENMADDFRIAVAERLLLPDENIVTAVSVRDAAQRRFADPNVVLLWRNAPQPNPVLFGLADNGYQQRQPEKGLITKREVRAVSLARLQLKAGSIVWDIGAGSGSVGLEAARLCPQGYVYAIEKNTGDAENAAANRVQLGIHNYHLRIAKAPDGLQEWPDPDAVFIGGSGGELVHLIELCLTRLQPGGWLVMNLVTVENLAVAMETLKAMQVQWDVTQLQTSRSKPILDMHRFAAENPVWIVAAQRPLAADSNQAVTIS
ncbi:MAG TPA: precorrin-6y C5,15-methyltransferase (decarboxylating) subunit CbiE [Candidatus Kapabacteria bacterium]|nr:precorrin-6y C5,15-methyltransferase (decarboxylating) subunit CbiE [Candidatus Kapabacteria bacterium]